MAPAPGTSLPSRLLSSGAQRRHRDQPQTAQSWPAARCRRPPAPSCPPPAAAARARRPPPPGPLLQQLLPIHPRCHVGKRACVRGEGGAQRRAADNVSMGGQTALRTGAYPLASEYHSLTSSKHLNHSLTRELAQPGAEHIRGEVNRGQPIDVVGGGQGEQRREAQHRDHAKAVLSNGPVHGGEAGVLLHPGPHLMGERGQAGGRAANAFQTGIIYAAAARYVTKTRGSAISSVGIGTGTLEALEKHTETPL